MADFVVVGLFMQLAILMVAMISLMRDRTILVSSAVAWCVYALFVAAGLVDCEALRVIVTGQGLN